MWDLTKTCEGLAKEGITRKGIKNNIKTEGVSLGGPESLKDGGRYMTNMPLVAPTVQKVHNLVCQAIGNIEPTTTAVLHNNGHVEAQHVHTDTNCFSKEERKYRFSALIPLRRSAKDPSYSLAVIKGSHKYEWESWTTIEADQKVQRSPRLCPPACLH